MAQSFVQCEAVAEEIEGRAPTRHGRQMRLYTEGVSVKGHATAVDADGRVVSVPGAMPGEEVLVWESTNRNRVNSVRLVEILAPSKDRVSAACPAVQRGCGGCQWQHMALGAQQRLKASTITDAFSRHRIAGIPSLIPTVQLSPWKYRTTVRAGVIDGFAGFRRRRSHEILATPECQVAHPLISELLTGRRYVGATEILLRCATRTGERLASVTPRKVHIDVPPDVGSHHLYEIVGGRRWRISAGSFFQTRSDGADALSDLVVAAADEIDGPRIAVDLYSGVGLFAGVLADRGWSLTSVERSPSAVADARENLHSLDVTVVGADVRRWRPTSARFVVADPSRAGLGSEGADTVARTGAKRLVLISCDAMSAGRDAALLRERGFDLTSVTQVDLFPHTFRVEVVAVYDSSC